MIPVLFHICREYILRLIEEILKGIMVSLSKYKSLCLAGVQQQNELAGCQGPVPWSVLKTS